ncbi:hypothetical protein AAVH_24044 [Aphelenchoides avenae]|nr:hypothetical protein AAVH_24044 [Aphelenchus avenae]
MASATRNQSENGSDVDNAVNVNLSADDDDDIEVLHVIINNDAKNNNGAEDTLDAKREKLSKWIQERRMVEDGLRLEIRQRDGRIASLTDGTKELESTQKQLRDQLHSLEERLRNEKSEREKIEKDRGAELKDMQKELDAKCSGLEADVQRLKTKLEEANEKCAQLEGNILVVRFGSVKLQEEKVELKEKVGEKENEITRLTIEKSRIEREALEATAALNNEVASLKEKLKAKEDEAEQLATHLKKEQEKGNTERLLTKIHELKDELRKKKDELYQAQKDLKAEREAPKAPTTFQATEARLNKLVKEKDNELNTLTHEKFKMEKDLREQISSLHREVAALKEQLAVKQVPAPAAPAPHEKSKMEKELRDQISSLHLEVAGLKEQLAAKQVPAPAAPAVSIAPPPSLPNAAALLRALKAVPPPPPPHAPAPHCQDIPRPPPPPPLHVETTANEPRKRRSAEPLQAVESHQPAGAPQTKTPSPPSSVARNLKDLSPGWKKFRPDFTIATPPAENVPTANSSLAAQNRGEASRSSTASSPRSPDANPAKLLVKNLHPKVTADMLTKIFHPFGELRSVEIAMKNGESRGFAHVEYVNVKVAMTALSKMNGFHMLERKLIVSGVEGSRLS